MLLDSNRMSSIQDMVIASPDNVSLVDEITYKKATEAHDDTTQSAILGPFFRHDHPIREKGATITFNTPEDGEVVYMHGTVSDAKTKKPLANAEVDVWQASTNGTSYFLQAGKAPLTQAQAYTNNRTRTKSNTIFVENSSLMTRVNMRFTA